MYKWKSLQWKRFMSSIAFLVQFQFLWREELKEKKMQIQ